MQPANLRLLTTGSHRPGATAEPLPDNGSAHIVHFYENDAELIATVADFLAEGLVSSQPLIVIATTARRQALLARLRSKGFDLEYLRRAGRFVLLDARETLAHILEAGSPDPRKFNSYVGTVVERIRRGSGHATVRAFGEMVDLLWREGNTTGAIRLEELWNELGARCALSLLSAHAAGPSYVMADEEAVEEVRREHTHVIRDGVGPGLAISRDQARGMGGDLRATSAVCESTTFELILPAADVPPAIDGPGNGRPERLATGDDVPTS